MSEDRALNCALIASAIHDSVRKQTAELEKNRIELAQIDKETTELIKKELLLLQKEIDKMKAASGGSAPGASAPGRSGGVEKSNPPPPPPPNSPVAKRGGSARGADLYRDISDDDV